MISGVVNSDGSVKQGEGFTARHYDQGFYMVEFTPPLSKPPVVVATISTDWSEGELTQHMYGDMGIATGDTNEKFFLISITSGERPQDMDFSFIAV